MSTPLVENERINNSKPFVLDNATAVKYDMTQDSMCGVPTVVTGSGNRCILYLHGGAYLYPPSDFNWDTISTIASRSGWFAVTPIYERVPYGNAGSVVPSMYEVYKQLLADDSISSIVVMGDSAGGGLALALCEYIAHMGSIQPDKMILLSPWLDIDMTNPDIEPYTHTDKLMMVHELVAIGEYYKQDADLAWLASPILNITSALAPVLMFVGECELFVPDCLLAKQLLEKANVDVQLHIADDMQHDFLLFPTSQTDAGRGIVINTLKEI